VEGDACAMMVACCPAELASTTTESSSAATPLPVHSAGSIGAFFGMARGGSGTSGVQSGGSGKIGVNRSSPMGLPREFKGWRSIVSQLLVFSVDCIIILDLMNVCD
jgi:hypothetical protein